MCDEESRISRGIPSRFRCSRAAFRAAGMAFCLAAGGSTLDVAGEVLGSARPPSPTRVWTAATGTAAAEAITKTVTVTIGNFTFAPETITVSPGTMVTWVNQDDIPHTIVEKDRKFKSHPLDTDERFSYTFTAPGVIEYYCSLHPRMAGRIVVKAEAASF
jgi:plastocyanin